MHGRVQPEGQSCRNLRSTVSQHMRSALSLATTNDTVAVQGDHHSALSLDLGIYRDLIAKLIPQFPNSDSNSNWCTNCKLTQPAAVQHCPPDSPIPIGFPNSQNPQFTKIRCYLRRCSLSVAGPVSLLFHYCPPPARTRTRTIMDLSQCCMYSRNNLSPKPLLPLPTTISPTYYYTPLLPNNSTPHYFPSMPISHSSSPSPPTLSARLPRASNLLQPFTDTDSHWKNELLDAIKASLSDCLSETHLDSVIPSLHSKTRGKVRDIYDSGDYLVLVTTDRQSAFDRVLASIPFKGQVLNETSLWWFNKTQHIIPNAVLSAPDKNVTIAKKCSVFPVEFVVRGYVTGSTDTSLWTVYQKGVRNYCGNALQDGLVKNQILPENIITPTTKAADHDVPITPEEIIRQGLMSEADYDVASKAALSLFEFGQRTALEHGLILVDTKYEFGKAPDGSVLLVDEVHTPDSSRYWIVHSYEERFQNGLEPENIDKEFLRLWFKDHCDPYQDKVLPDAPEELVTELAWRYILLYETITDEKFIPPSTKEPIHDRITRNVTSALSSL